MAHLTLDPMEVNTHSVNTFNIDRVWRAVVTEAENAGSSRVHRGIIRERLL